MADEVTFDYVKGLKDDKSVLLIDVREPSELEKTGKIPGSINIPLAILEETLQDTSEDYFHNKYKRDRPNLETPLVFHCGMGVRSQKALDVVKQLGYVNVKHFPGGWAGWNKQTKENVD